MEASLTLPLKDGERRQGRDMSAPPFTVMRRKCKAGKRAPSLLKSDGRESKDRDESQVSL